MTAPGRLVIQLLDGEFAKDKDVLGRMDPYLVFRLGTQTFRSSVRQNAGKFPVWNEKIELPYHQEDELHIAAFDEDKIGKDDKLGETSLSLHALLREHKFDGWVDLQDAKGVLTRHTAGRIKLHVIREPAPQMRTVDAPRPVHYAGVSAPTRSLDSAPRLVATAVQPMRFITPWDASGQTQFNAGSSWAVERQARSIPIQRSSSPERIQVSRGPIIAANQAALQPQQMTLNSGYHPTEWHSSSFHSPVSTEHVLRPSSVKSLSSSAAPMSFGTDLGQGMQYSVGGNVREVDEAKRFNWTSSRQHITAA